MQHSRHWRDVFCYSDLCLVSRSHLPSLGCGHIVTVLLRIFFVICVVSRPPIYLVLFLCLDYNDNSSEHITCIILIVHEVWIQKIVPVDLDVDSCTRVRGVKYFNIQLERFNFYAN